MSYEDTHKGHYTAPVLATNSRLAHTGTVLAKIVSSTALVMAASVNSILVYYKCRMNSEQGPATVSCSCAKPWLTTGTLRAPGTINY